MNIRINLTIFILYFAFFLILIPISPTHAVWFNTSMDYKTIDNVNYSSGVSLANFPYLINGSTGFNLGNPSNIQYVWTLATTVNGTNYLYFNNNSAYQVSNGSEESAQPFEIEAGNASNYTGITPLWDSNYVLVLHLNHNCTAGSQGCIKDSSIYGNNGTISTQWVRQNMSGVIYSGYSFNSTTNKENITINGSSSLDINGVGANLTLEAWVFLNSMGSVPSIIEKTNSAKAVNTQYSMWGWADGYWGANDWRVCCRVANGITDFTSCTAGGTNNGLKLRIWYYIGCTFNGTKWDVYLNGTLSNTTTNVFTIPTNPTGPLFIVGGVLSAAAKANITVDEIRVSNITRNPSYFNATYQNLKNSFSVLGASQSQLPPTCYTTNNGVISIPVGCALVLAITEVFSI